MYDQCMGDGYNNNQYYGGQCGGFGQWPYDGNYPTPWYNQCSWSNWHWYNGCNHYDSTYPTPCQHHYAQSYGGMQAPAMNQPNGDEYKLYQRHLSGHYMKPEAANMTAEQPLWKSVKIDCFCAKMDVHKTQSELLNKPTLNKTSARRKTKKRKLGATRSSTTLKNTYSKLGRKVHLNGGGLAYILFKPKDGECECAEPADRGDAQQQVPFTYYPSKKQHDLEQVFFEEINRRLSKSQAQPSHSSRHKQFIDNLNKLYSDIGGGLGTGEKRSVSQCTPEELDEIRHEFEVFFNQTDRSSKQTQTKLKMKSLKSNKSKSRTKCTMNADLTRHLRKSPPDGTSKSTKKSKLKVPATGRGAPSSEEQQPNGRERKTSKLYQLGSENGKRMSSTRLWRTSTQKERAPSTKPKSAFVSFKADGLNDTHWRRKPSVEKPSTSAHLTGRNENQGTKFSLKPQDDKPKSFMRSTYPNFNYVSAWGRRKVDS